MWHGFCADVTFCAALLRIDEMLVALVKLRGCAECGGRLDRADYPRKPRGAEIAAFGESWTRRFSLCCARDGCRSRATPPSVRFFGRRIYLGVVVLVTPMVLLTSTVPRRTIRRWLRWWQTEFPETPFFRGARGYLAGHLDRDALPKALIDRWRGVAADRVTSALHFLSPLTTGSVIGLDRVV